MLSRLELAEKIYEEYRTKIKEIDELDKLENRADLTPIREDFKKLGIRQELLTRYSDNMLRLTANFMNHDSVYDNAQHMNAKREQYLSEARFWGMAKQLLPNMEIKPQAEARSASSGLSHRSKTSFKLQLMNDITSLYRKEQAVIFESGNVEGLDRVRKEHRKFIEESLNIDSRELIHWMIHTDEELKRVRCVLQGFRTGQIIEETDLRTRETKFAEYMRGSQRDLRSMIENNHNDPFLTEFYDLIIEKMRCSGIDDVVEYLERWSLKEFSKFFRGFVPYSDEDILQEHGLKQELMELPDIMTSRKSRGNENWIPFIQEISRGVDRTTEKNKNRLLKLFAGEYLDSDVNFDRYSDKLWNMLRSYFNNEVMKKYIVARKIIGEKSMILYGEFEEIEEMFERSQPADILKQLFVSRRDFFYNSNLEQLMNTLEDMIEKISNTTHCDVLTLLLVLMFLRGGIFAKGEHGQENNTIVDSMKQWLRNLIEKEEKEGKVLKEEHVILAYEVLKRSFPEDFSKLDESLISVYSELYSRGKGTQRGEDLIVLNCILRSNKHIESLENLARYMSEVKDIRIVSEMKKKISDFFNGEDYNKIIQLIHEYSKKYSQSKNEEEISATDNVTWDWYVGTNSNKKNTLRFGIEHIKLHIRNRRWLLAATFNEHKLNRDIQKHIEDYRILERSGDLEFKKAWREKELLNRVLDCYMSAKYYMDNKLSTANEDLGKIFGINNVLYDKSNHMLVFEKILCVVFASNGEIVVDVNEYEDWKSIREVVLVQFLNDLLLMLKHVDDPQVKLNERNMLMFKLAQNASLINHIRPDMLPHCLKECAALALHNKPSLKKLL